MFLLLSACIFIDRPTLDARLDPDQDGVPYPDDCAPEDPSIYPGAPEVCDGVDQDCGGVVDEGVVSELYADSDGDGFGYPSAPILGCEGTVGYVTNDADCEDGDEAVYPDAAEICDGKDQDCDGVADDGLDGDVWYTDVDGDGYGDDATEVVACEPPEGGVAVGGDCDDANADYYPGAEEACGDPADYNCDGSTGIDDVDGDGAIACEDCDDANPGRFPGATETCDGVDQDCDGEADNDAVDAETSYLDADGDGYGDPNNSAALCERPSDHVDNSDDCDDDASGVHPAALEMCDDVDNDCDGGVDVDAIDATEWYLDADGDGYGVDDEVLSACDQPLGYAAEGGDCNDEDAAYNPGVVETEEAGPCGPDYDCSGEAFVDADADGAEDCDEDCDGSNPDVNPSAVEVCDDVDNNCDGDVDGDAVDAAAWFLDGDGDGYGDVLAYSCDQPEGYVGVDGDCDDADPAYNPGAMEEDCTDSNDYNCDGSVSFSDGDGDGYSACEDCDDANPDANPGGFEVCDDADNDCDGTVDNDALDATAFYIDTDGDTYGSPTTATYDCAAPDGFVPNFDDCDDADPAISPEAVETCDALDNDCDSQTDEPGAIGKSTFYADLDSDSFGDGTNTLAACDLPSGYVTTSGDCDDTDNAVSPAGVETCATAADDDCDGVTNAQDVAGCTRFYLDADSDGYGEGDGACFCEATTDGYWRLTDSDCDPSDPAVNPGAPELCDNGEDDDCDGDAPLCGVSDMSLSDADALYDGEAANDNAGQSVSFAGDVNDDGFDDMLIGAPYNDAEVFAGGSAYLVLGSDAPGSAGLGAHIRYSADVQDAYLGNSVAAAGDVNNDGFDDILLGAYGDSSTFDYGGAAYLFLGSESPASEVTSSADARYGALSDFDFAGYSVAGVGDTNGDGYDDVLIGAASDDVGGSNAGRAFLVWGSSGPTSEDLASNDFWGSGANEAAGEAVGAAGDTNADGLDDFLIGARQWNDGFAYCGAAYLVLGDTSDATVVLSAADARYIGEADDNAGYAVGAAGDVNADGYGDMVIGAPYSGLSDVGEAVVVLGASSPAGGSLDDHIRLLGGDSSSGAGWSVGGAGDVDADGYEDVLVGAPYANGLDGETYLVFGSGSFAGSSLSDAAQISGETDTGYAGMAVGGNGDANDDGYADILIGAPFRNYDFDDSGAAYLVLGGGI